MIKFKQLSPKFKIDNVWLTSDTHFHHLNYCKGTSTWDEEHQKGCRKFNTIEEMNDAIVDGINNNVKKDDLLIHLGDWSFGGRDKIEEFRGRIICRNIILLQGNHDHLVTGNEAYVHQTEYVERDSWIEFTQIGFYQVESLKFVCSHYPMSIWYQSHHNIPHYFGHVHNSFNNVGKSLDVGVDSAYVKLGTYRPFKLKEAFDLAMINPTYLESHHNSNTN